jgi:hypothetical protein
MRYYDLKKHWSKVSPHLQNPEVVDALVRDFGKYTKKRYNQTFKAGQYPRDFETCLWDVGHKGREPAYWKYVKHGACHWLANFELKLARLVEPKKPWRIITSDLHSTVWDREKTLFEFNAQAMGTSPQKCFDLACDEELAPGVSLELPECEPGDKNLSPEQRRLFYQLALAKYYARTGQPVECPEFDEAVVEIARQQGWLKE